MISIMSPSGMIEVQCDRADRPRSKNSHRDDHLAGFHEQWVHNEATAISDTQQSDRAGMTKKTFMAMKYHQPDTRRSTEQVGFTLIELMIGMALGLIVVAAAFTVLTTTSKALRANEQVVDTQQNLRMAMELLTRDIKLAGFGNPGVAVGNCSTPLSPVIKPRLVSIAERTRYKCWCRRRGPRARTDGP